LTTGNARTLEFTYVEHYIWPKINLIWRGVDEMMGTPRNLGIEGSSRRMV
jgi:hypothetical protein